MRRLPRGPHNVWKRSPARSGSLYSEGTSGTSSRLLMPARGVWASRCLCSPPRRPRGNRPACVTRARAGWSAGRRVARRPDAIWHRRKREIVDGRPEPRIGLMAARRVIPLGAAAIYLAATVVWSWRATSCGASCDLVSPWAPLGPLVVSLELTEELGSAAGLFDWLPFLRSSGSRRHAQPRTHSPSRFTRAPDQDRNVSHADTPTVWLQRHFYHPPRPRCTTTTSRGIVYLTHFSPRCSVAAYLWKWVHPQFLRWRTLVLWLSVRVWTSCCIRPCPCRRARSRTHQSRPSKADRAQMFPPQRTSRGDSTRWRKDFANKVGRVNRPARLVPAECFSCLLSRAAVARALLRDLHAREGLTLVYTAEHFVADTPHRCCMRSVVWFPCRGSGAGMKRRAAERAGVEHTPAGAPAPRAARRSPSPSRLSATRGRSPPS